MSHQKEAVRREELERRIVQLPVGYISRKVIQGKPRFYRQWMENGKIKSKYIKDGELEELKGQIEERKALEQELKQLRGAEPRQTLILPNVSYETNAVTGKKLAAMAKSVRSWERRDCYGQLQAYLRSEESDRVCLVFGLRRTGRTTMLRQAILDMSPEDAESTAYIRPPLRTAWRHATAT